MTATIDSQAFSHVSRRILAATQCEEVFGVLAGTTTVEQLKTLRRVYASLARVVHPDKVQRADKQLANESFSKLSKFASAARIALEAKSYGRSTRVDHSTWELTAGSNTYDVAEHALREGERSYVYRGAIRASGEPVIVKVAKTPQDNQYLDRETRILSLFTSASARSARAGVARYVPLILDTCFCVGADGKRYMASVAKEVAGTVSVEKILEVYPQGLDAPQAAWVARRILAQPLIAAMAGVVHTAILPQHVLVHPVTHEPLHIGWTHALDVGKHSVLLNLISQYADYYPPEVFDKVSFTHQMDMYMATKTVIALFGGVVKTNALPKSVPSAIATLLRSGVEKDPRSRPQDGKVFLDEFTRIVRKEWGSNYRVLEMPA